MRNSGGFIWNLGTWFGCGQSRRAPGTVGTIGALPLVWLIALAGEFPYMGFTLAFAAVSILIAQKFEDDFGEGRHDLPEFVMDEVAGFLVTMAMVPFTWTYVLAGFLLFRLLDILKPYPISWFDRKVPGGVGVVADDLLAGIVANVILQVALHFHVLPAGVAL
jgi:phosphatidylglycerophosphatase A